MNAAVRVDKLTKVFSLKKGSFFKPVHTESVAVDGITFQVEQGESVAFIGPNGAGKSTTIKMLTGILRPSSGLVEVLGLEPWSQRAKLAKNIGAVFGQRSQLWLHLPPRDSFELLACIYELSPADFRARRDILVERFAIGEFFDTPVRKLSLGQRMRAEVAASLLHKPSLIFLDEPTIGLDVIARQELRDLIREWNRDEGVTVVLTSHDAGDIESVAKRVLVINHGRLVLDDSVSALKRQYLNSKIIGVKFHEPAAVISMAGVKVLKASQYAMKLEVDSEKVALEKVVSEVMRAGTVADISIEAPPLEEVIAHIYGQSQGGDRT